MYTRHVGSRLARLSCFCSELACFHDREKPVPGTRPRCEEQQRSPTSSGSHNEARRLISELHCVDISEKNVWNFETPGRVLELCTSTSGVKLHARSTACNTSDAERRVPLFLHSCGNATVRGRVIKACWYVWRYGSLPDVPRPLSNICKSKDRAGRLAEIPASHPACPPMDCKQGVRF
jgi:hypothetical protein